eukprot:11183134-Karenia_brevis.AAC.1
MLSSPRHAADSLQDPLIWNRRAVHHPFKAVCIQAAMTDGGTDRRRARNNSSALAVTRSRFPNIVAHRCHLNFKSDFTS